MSVVCSVPYISRKSNRYSNSRRRRTSFSNHDRPGYGMGGRNESFWSTFHVKPGVVINFLDPHAAVAKAWGPPPVEHRSTHFKEKDSHWINKNSPHHRTLPLYDDRFPLGLDSHLPNDPRRSPRRDFATMVDPYHPDAHFVANPPPEEFYDADSFFEEDSLSQHVSSSPNRSPSSSPESFKSFLPEPSISSNSEPTFRQGYPVNLLDAPRSKLLMDPPPRPPRARRMSFDSNGRTSTTSGHGNSVRMVRFKENPVLPEPPPRRQGWFNRRGDQLWKNDGSYKPAIEPKLFPADLRSYPEPGTGWMNEEGIMIDMQQRLVRKKPLRSALKKSATI